MLTTDGPTIYTKFGLIRKLPFKIEFKKIKNLCKTLGFHGGNCEECCLLLCDAVWLLLDISPPSSG
jgi:hypothetical protein